MSNWEPFRKSFFSFFFIGFLVRSQVISLLEYATISNSMNLHEFAQNLLNLLRLALVYKLGWLQVSSKSFALYFLKGTHLGICRNGIFCTGARLFVFLASYLPNVMWLLSHIQDLTKC